MELVYLNYIITAIIVFLFLREGYIDDYRRDKAAFIDNCILIAITIVISIIIAATTGLKSSLVIPFAVLSTVLCWPKKGYRKKDES